MTKEQQVRLQAFLDGELPEREMREVAAWIAANPEAAALQLELTNTRQALKDFEKDIKLPESREFFWSKIERELNRVERAQAARPEVSPFLWLRRGLISAGGLAVVLVGLLIAWPRPATAQPEVETALADCGALTYRDEQAGMTVVWFSYGSENGLADRQPASTIP